MSKNFSQFVQEAYIKTINEEELAELLNDLAEEHDLTEEETQQVLDELFGSVVKKLGSFYLEKRRVVPPHRPVLHLVHLNLVPIL